MIAGSGAASGGIFKGIAPGSRILGIKVLDRKGNGYAADVLMGFAGSENTETNMEYVSLNIP